MCFSGNARDREQEQTSLAPVFVGEWIEFPCVETRYGTIPKDELPSFCRNAVFSLSLSYDKITHQLFLKGKGLWSTTACLACLMFGGIQLINGHAIILYVKRCFCQYKMVVDKEIMGT